jgi:hypothetical protein
MTKRTGNSSDGGGRKGSRENFGCDSQPGDRNRHGKRDEGQRPIPRGARDRTGSLAGKHHRRKRPARPKPEKKNVERPYTVGKGKPPVEHQWKPGQSGNNRGRPKGTKSEETILKQVLLLKIRIPIAGKIMDVTLREGIYYRMASDALAGNIKSATFLLNRFVAVLSGDKAAATMDDDDRAILLDYLGRIQSEREDGE